jgi:hypothetical protein
VVFKKILICVLLIFLITGAIWIVINFKTLINLSKIEVKNQSKNYTKVEIDKFHLEKFLEQTGFWEKTLYDSDTAKRFDVRSRRLVIVITDEVHDQYALKMGDEKSGLYIASSTWIKLYPDTMELLIQMNPILKNKFNKGQLSSIFSRQLAKEVVMLTYNATEGQKLLYSYDRAKNGAIKLAKVE